MLGRIVFGSVLHLTGPCVFQQHLRQIDPYFIQGPPFEYNTYIRMRTYRVRFSAKSNNAVICVCVR